MNTWMSHNYIHTHSHTYIHRYNEFVNVSLVFGAHSGLVATYALIIVILHSSILTNYKQ